MARDRRYWCYMSCFLLAMLALAAVSPVVGVRSTQGDVLLHSHHPLAVGGWPGNRVSLEEEAA